MLNWVRKTVQRGVIAYAVMFLSLMTSLSGCHPSNPATNYPEPGADRYVYTDRSPDGTRTFTYHLSSPDHKVLLPPILREISGITMLDSLHLAGIQDEEGRVFIFRISNGMIERTIPFAENGDYEDIIIAGDTIYILKSNGNIYMVEQYDHPRPLVTRFKTPLSSRNDCEGICYLNGLNSLLVACKGAPSLNKDQHVPGVRAIYRFTLTTGQLDTVPFISIYTGELASQEPMDWYQGISVRMANRLNQNGNIVFQPSGIAVHPVTGNLYILAHVGKMILIIDLRGEILGRVAIDPTILPQPEGICFDHQGVLMIVSEGIEADAILTVYHPEVTVR